MTPRYVRELLQDLPFLHYPTAFASNRISTSDEFISLARSVKSFDLDQTS